MQYPASDITNTQTAWLPYLTVKFLLINETDRQFVLFFPATMGPQNVVGPGETSPISTSLMGSRGVVRAPQWGLECSPSWKRILEHFLHHRNCIWWHQISCFCRVKCKLSKYRIHRTFSQNIGQYTTLFKNLGFVGFKGQVEWLCDLFGRIISLCNNLLPNYRDLCSRCTQ